MTGMRCNVAACKNSLAKTKKDPKLKNVRFHSFPKDEETRKRWVTLCRRPGDWNPGSCHVCSIHFSVNDYERNLKAELLNIPHKKCLKYGAVPSRNLDEGEANISESGTGALSDDAKPNPLAERMEKQLRSELVREALEHHQVDDATQRMAKKMRMQIVKEALEHHRVAEMTRQQLERRRTNNVSKQASVLSTAESVLMKNKDGVQVVAVKQPIAIAMKPPIKNAQMQVQEYTYNEKLDNMRRQLKEAYKQLGESGARIRKLDMKLRTAQRREERLKLQNKKLAMEIKSRNKMTDKMLAKECEEKVREKLLEIFTETQMNVLLKKKGKITWSEEELSRAFRLRYLHLGYKAYRNVRKMLKYPLPSIGTLMAYSDKLMRQDGEKKDELSVETPTPCELAVELQTPSESIVEQSSPGELPVEQSSPSELPVEPQTQYVLVTLSIQE